MTALDKFIRLEAVGQWRENADAETIEVIVSFGDSTLQLTSLQDTPITHWALRATKPIGTKGSAVIYSADSLNSETLTVDDVDMTRAIRAVTNEIIKPVSAKKKKGRFGWLVIAAVFIALLSQSPPLIYKWAVNLTSPARMKEFVETVQSNWVSSDDIACKDNRGSRAISIYTQGLFDEYVPAVIVLKTGAPRLIGISDTVLYVPFDIIENADDHTALASAIALNYAMSDRRALLHTSLKSAGPWASIRHIMGNNIEPTTSQSHAAPIAADFVLARDRLQDLEIDAEPLQKMAAELGIGLPVNTDAQNSPYHPATFADIKQFCAL